MVGGYFFAFPCFLVCWFIRRIQLVCEGHSLVRGNTGGDSNATSMKVESSCFPLMSRACNFYTALILSPILRVNENDLRFNVPKSKSRKGKSWEQKTLSLLQGTNCRVTQLTWHRGTETHQTNAQWEVIGLRCLPILFLMGFCAFSPWDMTTRSIHYQKMQMIVY